MDNYGETFETWNNIARLYEDKFMHLALYNDSYDDVCRVLKKPHSKLLDIGCGPGNISRYLLAKRPDFDVFGIDVAPNMVELAKRNNPAADFAVMDSRQIDQLKAGYDGIICGFCLPYLSDIESKKLISDIYGLLNGDGLVYLSFVAGDPSQSGFKSGHSGRVFFYFHKTEDLEKELADSGFSEINISEVMYKRSETESEVHTILTARKR